MASFCFFTSKEGMNFHLFWKHIGEIFNYPNRDSFKGDIKIKEIRLFLEQREKLAGR
jgi:hypothetical protein